VDNSGLDEKYTVKKVIDFPELFPARERLL
jgi:hypothetical protein